MQTSGKKACFQLPECSLGYAKVMQTIGKRGLWFRLIVSGTFVFMPFTKSKHALYEV